MTDANIDGTDPLVDLADMTLHVSRKLRAYPIRNPEVAELTLLECLVLLHVHRQPGVSPTNVAHELALTSANAATALRGLVKKGQLERRADPDDGRAARLHLTEAAERAVIIVRRTWHDLLEPAGLPDEDIRTAVRVLTAVDAILAEP